MSEKKSRLASVKSFEDGGSVQKYLEPPLADAGSWAREDTRGEQMLTLKELESELAASDGPLLVAFLADGWRPSDRTFDHVKALADDAGIKLVVADPMEAAAAHRLMTLPTFLLFSGAREQLRIQGARSRRSIDHQLGPAVQLSQEPVTLLSGAALSLPRGEPATPA